MKKFRPGEIVRITIKDKVKKAIVIAYAGCCNKVLIEFPKSEKENYLRRLVKEDVLEKIESINEKKDTFKYPFYNKQGESELIDVKIIEELPNCYIAIRLDNNKKVIIPK